jgi:hypothetical protein
VNNRIKSIIFYYIYIYTPGIHPHTKYSLSPSPFTSTFLRQGRRILHCLQFTSRTKIHP